MPTYPFSCLKCDKEFQIYQSIKEYNGQAECPTCGNISKDRVFFPCNITFLGAKSENAEYNPGLGIVTKNSRHRRDEARARGLEEVGNEKPDKIHNNYAQEREIKRKKSWDSV